ncbi:MAG: hypothetical protein MZV70_54250 [Desulfobacterales bacterium]|nr:hypothetical protein [Desulfobacterales bacterium]
MAPFAVLDRRVAVPVQPARAAQQPSDFGVYRHAVSPARGAVDIFPGRETEGRPNVVTGRREEQDVTDGVPSSVRTGVQMYPINNARVTGRRPGERFSESVLRSRS